MGGYEIHMTDSDILDIELELTGFCNLKCPLCASVLFADRCGGVNIRPLGSWIEQLDRYDNLKSVCMSGICSEPTLYPWIFELIDYITGRGISIELYTNGNTHDAKWWNELNRHMTERDLVIFTICGSTQEIHGKYRVGSNLKTIMDNARSFMLDNRHQNDCVQHIMFRYNADDFRLNMKPIINMFHNRILIETSPIAERYGIETDGICMDAEKGRKYARLVSDVMSRRRLQRGNLCCKSKETGFISIDQFGNEYPCMLYRLFSTDMFDRGNYGKIDSFSYGFCYDCDKRFLSMSKTFKIEGMI